MERTMGNHGLQGDPFMSLLIFLGYKYESVL